MTYDEWLTSVPSEFTQDPLSCTLKTEFSTVRFPSSSPPTGQSGAAMC